jgi:tRNA threonylcarbamoyladenosine biosynthesis protein TsaE
MEQISRSPKDTMSIGTSIAATLEGGAVVVLIGALGSGKTVLTKGIALGIGVEDTVTSPSFAILNVYEGKRNLYHFDFYRLDDPVEMGEMLEDYLYRRDGVTVIEWGERIMGILRGFLHVSFRISGAHRLINVERRDG